jgi:RimJ/RimL family protein N-acetyltransferase
VALVGTLDRGVRRQIEREGTGPKARGVINGVRALVRDAGWRADAGWWRLGYAAGGALVGFVIPVVNASGDGTIWWIGVVPEQRGQRYVDELLGAVVESLTHAGVKRIVSDTDTENLPMAHAFLRCGFRQFATSTTYKITLA